MIFPLEKFHFFDECRIFHIVDADTRPLFDMLKYIYSPGKLLAGFQFGLI